MNLGPTVKFLRVSSGLRQQELAKALGITPDYVSMIETGRREPSVSILKRMAEEFDVPIALFFMGDQPVRRGERGASAAADLESKLRELLLELGGILARTNESRTGKKKRPRSRA